MADFFTHNAPNYGEDTLMGPPGTSIAGKFSTLAMSLQAKTFSLDPLHTVMPWTRAASTIAIPAYASNQLRNLNPGDPGYTDPPKRTPETSLVGQYVGPSDMIAPNTIRGYIPRQDWQNAVRQDPLSNLLGSMQKPVPKQPEPASAFEPRGKPYARLDGNLR
jgi:hypothetical protein